MNYEEGQVILCPSCQGLRLDNKNRPCKACKGEGKMEYSTQGGLISAPAGTWFPTKRRGKTGWLVVLFGPSRRQDRSNNGT